MDAHVAAARRWHERAQTVPPPKRLHPLLLLLQLDMPHAEIADTVVAVEDDDDE
jgi:hypothetical protein